MDGRQAGAKACTDANDSNAQTRDVFIFRDKICDAVLIFDYTLYQIISRSTRRTDNPERLSGK
jgi:hypothetical protein